LPPVRFFLAGRFSGFSSPFAEPQGRAACEWTDQQASA
jgi:hypothetical protein